MDAMDVPLAGNFWEKYWKFAVPLVLGLGFYILPVEVVGLLSILITTIWYLLRIPQFGHHAAAAANDQNVVELQQEEDIFDDAEDMDEPEPIFPILQIIGRTRLHVREPIYPVFSADLLQHFRTEKFTSTSTSSRSSKAADAAPLYPNVMYQFSGKVGHTTGVKLTRFCVRYDHLKSEPENRDLILLWNFLKTATEDIPESCKQMWVEQEQSEAQDKFLTDTLNSIPDSGIEYDNGLNTQCVLYLDENEIWQCSEDRGADIRYIYFQLLNMNIKSLTAIMQNLQPSLATALYEKFMYKLAKYIQKLHNKNMAHGYIKLRNVMHHTEMFDSEVFILSESLVYFEKQFLDSNYDDAAKARRSCFDERQKRDPTDFDKSSDVYAFGLCLMEMMCKRDARKSFKMANTESRLISLLNTVAFDEFNVRFGGLLRKILVSRADRITIDDVLRDLEALGISD